MTLTHEQITEKTKMLHFNGKAFINGKLVDALSGKTFDCINPATGKLLTKVAACDEKDIHTAVLAARKAFLSGYWSTCSLEKRKLTLLKLADLIEKHQFTIALMETLDTGKPIKDSLRGSLEIHVLKLKRRHPRKCRRHLSGIHV